MKQTPLISVILPFYNAESSLERAVHSILEQDYSSFELILVNNNSTDKSLDIARNLASKDKRIVLTEEPLQGVVFAFKKGYALAKGSFIARMDADDEALTAKLRKQASFLIENPKYGVVAGLAEHIAHSANTEGFARYVRWSNSLKSHDAIYTQRFVESPIINPTAMWRKEISDTYGIYREGDSPEDYEMWLRWLEAGVKIAKLDEHVLKWYDSDERLTRTHHIYNEAAFYRIKSHYLALWLKKYKHKYPSVYIWGASRISRGRVAILESYGVEVEAYIDIKKDRQIGKKIIYYKDIPEAGTIFILLYLPEEKSKKRTRTFLIERAYTEGKDFLAIS